MTARHVGAHAETLVVICRANAARSPLVAGLLRRGLDGLGRRDLRVTSAGLEATPRTSATEEAVEVALALGVDLAGHHATRVTEQLVGEAALVITMTESQRDLVERLVRSTVSHTFTLMELIRLLEGSGHDAVADWSEMARQAHRARPFVAPAAAPEDVADPVGQPWRHYRALADRLAGLTDQVVVRLEAAPSVTSG